MSGLEIYVEDYRISKVEEDAERRDEKPLEVPEFFKHRFDDPDDERMRKQNDKH